MAKITPGSGGTFSATTAEGCLLQAIKYAAMLELSAGSNPQAREYISGTSDIDIGSFKGRVSLPFNSAINSDGSSSLAILPYLNNTNFSTGSGGTFRATSIEAYIWEISIYLMLKQNITSDNPNQKYLITAQADFSLNPFLMSISFSIAYSSALTPTGVEDIAVPYLLPF